MSNKVDVFTNIKCKSLFSKTIPATSEEETWSERMCIRVTPSMKEAILKRVSADRKPGENIYGAISKFVREAIYLHLSRK